jgi:hypothetical protein
VAVALDGLLFTGKFVPLDASWPPKGTLLPLSGKFVPLDASRPPNGTLLPGRRDMTSRGTRSSISSSPPVWSLLEGIAPTRALAAACGTGRLTRRLVELGLT